MKNKKIKWGWFLALAVMALPIMASGYTIQQFFGNYNLGGLQTAQMDFEVTDDNLKYQSNAVTVTNLVHDAGGSTCNFCELKVTGKKKTLIFFWTNIGKNSILTPTTGMFDGADFGNVGSGEFRYEIQNYGAIQNSGSFRVDADSNE